MNVFGFFKRGGTGNGAGTAPVARERLRKMSMSACNATTQSRR